ncbi:MAG: hypothetical protein ACYSWP_06430 [Planctomycetota bacterium]|jgi:hypothetical protein
MEKKDNLLIMRTKILISISVISSLLGLVIVSLLFFVGFGLDFDARWGNTIIWSGRILSIVGLLCITVEVILCKTNFFKRWWWLLLFVLLFCCLSALWTTSVQTRAARPDVPINGTGMFHVLAECGSHIPV